MTATAFFIYLFGAIAIVGAVGMLLQRNPIFAALSLAVTFMSLSAIYAALNAHFLAAIQLIIYTGLIQVLIIYTIMLMDLSEADIQRKFNPARLLGVLVAGLFGIQLVGAAFSGPVIEAAALPEGYGTTAAVAQVLFSTYLLPFEVVAVLLLAGVVAAVLLAKSSQRPRGQTKLSEDPTPMDTESSVNPKLIKR